ncbi:MAG: LPS-assembly protein LptD [SAR324 cluster bacterium]|nr:LPS-assembly protein LptD [SAR324 cluster bacterium]
MLIWPSVSCLTLRLFRLFFFVWGVISLFSYQEVRAQSISNYSSNRTEFSVGQEKIEYENPHFTVGTATIKANRASLNTKTNLISLWGVVYSDHPIFLYAHEAEIDVNQISIELTDISLFDSVNKIYARAKFAKRLTGDKYYIEGGFFTQCPAGEDAWEMRADKMYYEIENYAFGYHAWFRFYDIPILYSPVYAFPTTTKRKSGFLLPAVSIKNISKGNGYGIMSRTPYFINIAPDQDITINGEIYTGRGLALGIEYNFAFNQQQKGQLFGWSIAESFAQRKLGEEYRMTDDNDKNPTRHHFYFSYQDTISKYGSLQITGIINSDSRLLDDYPIAKNGVSDIYNYDDRKRYMSASMIFSHSDHLFSVYHDLNERFLYSSRYDKKGDDNSLSQSSLGYEKSWFNVFKSNLSFIFRHDTTNFNRQIGWNAQKNKSVFTLKYPHKIATLDIYYDFTYEFLHYNTRYIGPRVGNFNFNSPENFAFQRFTNKILLSNKFRFISPKNNTKLKIIPFIEFTERSDIEQRGLLKINSQAKFSYTNSDYSSYQRKLSGESFLLTRKSVDLGLSLTLKKRNKNPYLNFKLSSTWDLLDGMNNSKSIYKGPIIEEGYQEIGRVQKFNLLRFSGFYHPNKHLFINTKFRYHIDENNLLERKIGLSFQPERKTSARITYYQNDKNYKDLDGGLFPKAENLTINSYFILTSRWNVRLGNTWNFLRKDLLTNARYQRLDNLLTYSNIDFNYRHCCYNISLGYRENLRTRTIANGNIEEYIEQSIYLNFGILDNELKINSYF